MHIRRKLDIIYMNFQYGLELVLIHRILIGFDVILENAYPSYPFCDFVYYNWHFHRLRGDISNPPVHKSVLGYLNKY